MYICIKCIKYLSYIMCFMSFHELLFDKKNVSSLQSKNVNRIFSGKMFLKVCISN